MKSKEIIIKNTSFVFYERKKTSKTNNIDKNEQIYFGEC
jgi:hypothetical protein